MSWRKPSASVTIPPAVKYSDIPTSVPLATLDVYQQLDMVYLSIRSMWISAWVTGDSVVTLDPELWPTSVVDVWLLDGAGVTCGSLTVTTAGEVKWYPFTAGDTQKSAGGNATWFTVA